mmetsp:Transcript_96094/g.275997  ORF Transcript_96094/g.275997 Transcript_96094/m.275997 type:complete len:261 (+) Transcript_96094:779-1561(+)
MIADVGQLDDGSVQTDENRELDEGGKAPSNWADADVVVQPHHHALLCLLVVLVLRLDLLHLGLHELHQGVGAQCRLVEREEDQLGECGVEDDRETEGVREAQLLLNHGIESVDDAYVEVHDRREPIPISPRGACVQNVRRRHRVNRACQAGHRLLGPSRAAHGEQPKHHCRRARHNPRVHTFLSPFVGSLELGPRFARGPGGCDRSGTPARVRLGAHQHRQGHGRRDCGVARSLAASSRGWRGQGRRAGPRGCGGVRQGR